MVEEGLARVENDVSGILVEACKISMRTFREENRIATSEELLDSKKDEEREAFLVGDETHKQMPYTQEATMRTHFKRISRYIRVVDLQSVDARLSLIARSLRLIKEVTSLDFTYNQKHTLDGNRLQACALFQINIGLQETLTFSP